MARASAPSSHSTHPNIDECVAQIWQSKEIATDQCVLLQAWLLQMDGDIAMSRERQAIDRLLHAVRRGWIVMR